MLGFYANRLRLTSSTLCAAVLLQPGARAGASGPVCVLWVAVPLTHSISFSPQSLMQQSALGPAGSL